MNEAVRVPKRIASIILNSLKGGVVPRMGLPYITVGRDHEVDALLHDLDLVSSGGASFRFLVGRYGSGKSFMLQTMRTHALGHNFVVADADLSPERRLQGSAGQGIATYRELMRNLSTKTRPEGGALNLILERWAQQIEITAQEELAAHSNEQAFSDIASQKLDSLCSKLSGLVRGFEFSKVLKLWWQARQQSQPELQAACLKWLRGEYNLKSEAKAELGMQEIISDANWYDYIKLLALFLREAEYEGLIVLIDELVNLYKIPNPISRQYNYEKILTMYNDTLQGKAQYLNIIMSGTPESVEDDRRGLFSYEALASRLKQGRFAREDMRDMLAPIIHLHQLSDEELLILIEKLAQIHAGYYGYEPHLSERDLADFLQIELNRIGASQLLTPREVIRDFIELLDILLQNPTSSFTQIISATYNQNEAEITKMNGAAQLLHSTQEPDTIVDFFADLRL